MKSFTRYNRSKILCDLVNITKNREGRKEIDLVSDGVENSLGREVDKIRECQARMKGTLEQVQIGCVTIRMSIFVVQVNYQLGVNKDCRHHLEKDLANKDHGINIDHTVHNMKNNSGGINLHGGIERVDNHVSIPDSWMDYSHRNIQVIMISV